jgi:hypothetical protein
VALLGVCVLTSTEKWAKVKNILDKWWKLVSSRGTLKLSHKELLSDCGFLVYVTRTYPPMIPYLKGFHLTIEMWRVGQDAEGWKLLPGDDSLTNLRGSLSSIDVTRAGGHGMDLSMAATYLANHAKDEDVAGANHRVRLKMGDSSVYAPDDGLTVSVPRFKDNIAALRQLTDFNLPPLRVVRPTQGVQVFYGYWGCVGQAIRGHTLPELQLPGAPCKENQGPQWH